MLVHVIHSMFLPMQYPSRQEVDYKILKIPLQSYHIKLHRPQELKHIHTFLQLHE